MVVALVLTSANSASLTTVANVTVSVLYAPTPPYVATGQVIHSCWAMCDATFVGSRTLPPQVLTLSETAASSASSSNPAWTLPVSATSINAAPVTLTYTLLAAYGGSLSDGAAPLLVGPGNPVVVNATTGAIGLNVPLVVTDASQFRAVGLFITRAAYTATVLVVDNSGLSSTVNVSMLVLVANSATNNALLTGVSPTIGLDTLGGTSITLKGSSFEGLVGRSPLVTYGVRSWR